MVVVALPWNACGGDGGVPCRYHRGGDGGGVLYLCWDHRDGGDGDGVLCLCLCFCRWDHRGGDGDGGV